jgi:hypothetical protein
MPVFKCAKGKLSGDNHMREFQSRDSGFKEQRNNALRIIYCLFLASLSSFWSIRCQDNAIDNRIIVEPPPIIIYGSIIDSITNQPLQAWVGFDSVFDSSLSIFTIADTNGNYRIPGHPSRTQIFAGMDGYGIQMKLFQLNAGDSIDIDFKLIER